MQFDKENLLSDVQTLVLAAGSYLSTHSIDLWQGRTAMPTLPSPFSSTPVHDPGRSGPMLQVLVMIHNPLISAAGNATLIAQLVMGTGVDGSGQINAGLVVLATSGDVLLAPVAPGAFSGRKLRISGSMPIGINLRYLAVRYVIGVAALTGGTVTAALVSNFDSTYN